MNIFPFQAIFPKVDLITSADSFFGSMKEQFSQYYKSGFFDKSPQEGLYVYRITSKNLRCLGLIAATDIHDFLDEKILKHEQTLAAKEQKMMQLILQRKALIKPVLLAYEEQADVSNILRDSIKGRKPLLKINFEGLENELHTIWKIKDPEKVEKIRGVFATKITKSYISDGHHRCSTSSILYKSNNIENGKARFSQILSIYFPIEQLQIWDYNRVAEVFNTLELPVFLTRLSKYCKIKELKNPRKPKSKHEMTMYMKNYWFSLKWKKKVLASYSDRTVLLDSEIFNTKIMGDILQIEDVRESKKVKYYSGKLGTSMLEEEVNKNQDKVAFCIYPVLKEEILAYADSFKTLPPKSTWFEPRMKNGLISKLF